MSLRWFSTELNTTNQTKSKIKKSQYQPAVNSREIVRRFPPPSPSFIRINTTKIWKKKKYFRTRRVWKTERDWPYAERNSYFMWLPGRLYYIARIEIMIGVGGGGEKINGKKKNTTWTWRTEKNLSRPINTGVRASTGPRSFTRTVKISSFCSLPPCGARRSPAPRRFGRPARIDIARGFHRYNIVIIKIILYDTCSRVISIELLLRSRSRHDYETSTLL